MTTRPALGFLLTVVLGSLASAGVPLGIEPGIPARTDAQTELVAWATERFNRAGLELPPVSIIFVESVLECAGHKGQYFHRQRLLRMCSLDRPTMLHELAHAWAHDNLTDDQRRQWISVRGLRSWNDHQTPWGERGTEHFAEALMWALMDEDTTVPWVTDSGQLTRRLLTIPDSAPASLAAALREVIGLDDVPDTRADPIRGFAWSPEAAE